MVYFKTDVPGILSLFYDKQHDVPPLPLVFYGKVFKVEKIRRRSTFEFDFKANQVTRSRSFETMHKMHTKTTTRGRSNATSRVFAFSFVRKSREGDRCVGSSQRAAVPVYGTPSVRRRSNSQRAKKTIDI